MKEVTDPNILAQLNATTRQPVTDPAILEQLNQQPQDAPTPMGKWDAIKQGFGITKDAIQGNDEFQDAGNIQDYINTKSWGGLFDGDAWKLAGSSMFGNDEDLINTFRRQEPETSILQDNTGNRYIEKEIDGELRKFYFNRGGADLGDVVDTVGEAGTYLAGGGLTAPIKGLTARTLATGATEAGINVGNQFLAGRDEIDKSEAALAGAGGAAFELVSPYAGKLFNWAKSKLTGSGGNIQLGAKIAADAGLENVDNATLEAMGVMRNSVDDAVPDQAIIAEVKHGMKLTRAQATGNPDHASIEEGLRNRTGLMDNFRKVDDLNNEATEQGIRNIRSSMYGTADDVLEPVASAQTALEGLKTAKQTAEEGYKKAFEQVGDLSIDPRAVDKLSNRVANTLKANKVRISKRGTGEALEALEIIDEAQQFAKQNGSFSLGDYKEYRSYIDNLYDGKLMKNDKRALTVIKKEFDDWFYTSVDDSLLSGSPEALAQLKEARGMMTDYMNRFQSKDKAKKVITRIVNEDVTPEQFSNMLVNVNGLSNAGAANSIKAYKEAVGADSEAFKALQASILDKLVLGGVNPRTGQGVLKGSESLVNTFYNAYNKKGVSMMKELYDNKTANEIKSLMRSVGMLVKDRAVKNQPGSGKLAAQIMSQHGNKFPILSNIFGGLKSSVQFMNATNMPAKAGNQVVRQVGLSTLPAILDE